ncbi:MAG: sensor histidine kinase, partial [Acidobacteriota bacterium]
LGNMRKTVAQNDLGQQCFAIQVNAALLERAAPLGPEAEQALRFVREHVDRLNALLKDILELGETAGEEAFAECAARSLLEEASAQLASVLPQAGRRVVVQVAGLEKPLRVLRHAVVRALYHLLKNAAEAAPHGEILLTAAEEEGAAVLRVLDRGPGLPPELGEKIFEPFVSGKAGHRGLGLPLARHYVEQSHGTLRAENRLPSPGAVFLLRLPLAT